MKWGWRELGWSSQAAGNLVQGWVPPQGLLDRGFLGAIPQFWGDHPCLGDVAVVPPSSMGAQVVLLHASFLGCRGAAGGLLRVLLML